MSLISAACFEPTSVMKVIRSWETARQRHGFDEQLGIDTLLFLFKMDPRIKQIFGFAVDKEVKAEGMQRMGILIHGLRIVKMLDGIFAVIGPDEDILSEVLADMGEQHCQLGLSPDHFTLLCRALLEVLEKIMGDEWTTDMRSAWFHVIRVISVEIAKNMQKRMQKVCRRITAEDIQAPTRTQKPARRSSLQSNESFQSKMPSRSEHSRRSIPKSSDHSLSSHCSKSSSPRRFLLSFRPRAMRRESNSSIDSFASVFSEQTQTTAPTGQEKRQ